MRRQALRSLLRIAGIGALLQAGAAGCATEASRAAPGLLGGDDAGVDESSVSSPDVGQSSQAPNEASAPPVTGAVDAAPSAESGATTSRGPTPPTAGSNFPFPQNRQSSGCTYQSNYENSDVQAAYAQSKSDMVTSNGAG